MFCKQTVPTSPCFVNQAVPTAEHDIKRSVMKFTLSLLLFLHTDTRFKKYKSDCNQNTVIQFLSNQNTMTQFLSPFAVFHGKKQWIPTVD